MSAKFTNPDQDEALNMVDPKSFQSLAEEQTTAADSTAHDEVSITDKAIEHVKNCLTKRGSGMGIRLAVKSSGCSSWSYVLDFVDEVQQDDYHYEVCDEFCIYVAREAYPHLKGMCIDLSIQGLNQKLVFINPNAKNACGCGESFDT